MNVLDLPLKKEWFEMIERGEKREEYRAIKPYWIKRFCFSSRTSECRERQTACAECFSHAAACCGYMCYPYTHVRFRYGYTKRTILKEIETIEFGYGNPKWGAPKGKMVFIIKLKND